MGIWSFLTGRSLQPYDFGTIIEASNQSAMKSIALETCVNYIARTFAKAQFKINKDDIRSTVKFNKLDKMLNVRPNANTTASEFWVEFIQNLLSNGEALIYFDKHRMALYNAESFVRNQNYQGDTFTGIVIQGQLINETVKADDVIYLKSDNASLNSFISDLWNDYGQVMGQLLANQKRSGQLRATIDIPKNAVEAKNAADFIQKTVNKIENDSVVLIPQDGALKYNEITNAAKQTTTSTLSDISTLKKQYIDDVADILGIPNGLVHGDLADNQKNYDTFILSVIDPLTRKIVNGLQNLIGGSSVARINIYGLKNYDIFDLSTSIDKLISSGAFNRNEIRAELGFEPIENGDKFVITKNYTSEEV